MPERKVRRFSIDGDTVEVEYYYDTTSARWCGDYPVFTESPRYTPGGKPWRNVFDAECDFSDSEFGDCGGCSYYYRETPKDIIGVCYREEMKLISDVAFDEKGEVT